MPSKALGLTRQGWNAYQEKRKNHQSISDGAVYARGKALGISNKNALKAAAEFWGLEDERSVRHRLSKARSATPRRTKPTS